MSSSSIDVRQIRKGMTVRYVDGALVSTGRVVEFNESTIVLRVVRAGKVSHVDVLAERITDAWWQS